MTLGEKGLAYARLLRLSNGPTAVADVWMGYAVLHGVLTPNAALLLVTATSLLLYHAGMIGNDLADVFEDREEKRDRPIANLQIYGWDAMRLQRRMELVALALAAIASWVTSLLLPFLVAVVLWWCIRWYNSPIKRTAGGPLFMGACRGLNASLGMSVAGYGPELLTIPLGVSIYIAGVTFYARDERSAPSRRSLGGGLSISLIGIGLIAFLPFANPGWSSIDPTSVWVPAWLVAAATATRGMFAAILQPTPRNIGRGVGIAIQGLVVIDAVLAAFYAGPVAGLAILALLPVTMLLAQWIPQT